VYYILFFILIPLSIEATTELVSKSEFFSPVREWVFNKKSKKVFNFIHSVLDCPYCLSVWVSMFSTLFFYLVLYGYLPSILLILPTILIFHRLSNIIHFSIDRLWGVK